MGNYQIIAHFMVPAGRECGKMAPARISAEEYLIKRK
jgi:hypothetical protein